MIDGVRKSLIALACIFFIGGASQASVTFTILSGNDPGPSGDLTEITDELFSVPTGFGFIGKIDITDAGGQDVEDDGVSFTLTGTPGKSGTWSISGFDVFAVAIKGGNNFLLVDYTRDGPVSGDNWCTDATCLISGSTPPQLLNGGGKNPDISHLTLYGTTSVVPEPATWLMMIFGFALTATAYRRRLRVA